MHIRRMSVCMTDVYMNRPVRIANRYKIKISWLSLFAKTKSCLLPRFIRGKWIVKLNGTES